MRDLAGLKICFVAGTLGQGGSERQLYYMLQALLHEGAQPRVLCLTSGEYWEQPIRELGVAVTWVGQSHSRIRRLRRIIDALREDPPRIVQSQHFYTNIYVTAAARWLGLEEIGALRSNGISEIGANQAVFGRVSLHTPRMIAANSRAGIDNAVTLGVHRSRMHFLPNVVDTARFSTPSRSANGAVHLLTVGRMVPAKRFDRFIRVLADVRQRSRTPVKGTIVGDGEERAQLELLAQRAELLPDGLEF
ncbi:MAG TPA: glycosyltransferase, partial [Gemmatimonadaceae bacterium]